MPKPKPSTAAKKPAARCRRPKGPTVVELRTSLQYQSRYAEHLRDQIDDLATKLEAERQRYSALKSVVLAAIEMADIASLRIAPLERDHEDVPF